MKITDDKKGIVNQKIIILLAGAILIYLFYAGMFKPAQIIMSADGSDSISVGQSTSTMYHLEYSPRESISAKRCEYVSSFEFTSPHVVPSNFINRQGELTGSFNSNLIGKKFTTNDVQVSFSAVDSRSNLMGIPIKIKSQTAICYFYSSTMLYCDFTINLMDTECVYGLTDAIVNIETAPPISQSQTIQTENINETEQPIIQQQNVQQPTIIEIATENTQSFIDKINLFIDGIIQWFKNIF
jgi:hypothetical protein